MIDEVRVPRLLTERLILREWTPADLKPFAALNSDPEVAASLGGSLTRDESDALVERIMAGWRDRGFGLWAVARVDDDSLLGFAGLSVPSWAPEPEPEIGWRFARHAWGSGYATEAGREAMRFAFEVLELERLVSYTAVTNVRSRRVMERLGMHRDGPGRYDFLHPRLPDGHPLREHVTYRLSRAAWAVGRAGSSAGAGRGGPSSGAGQAGSSPRVGHRESSAAADPGVGDRGNPASR